MKKITTDMTKDGFFYKLIFICDDDEKLAEVMQKPNWKLMGTETHVSGFHVFRDAPEENHYDHYYAGIEWKERSTKDNDITFPDFWPEWKTASES